MFTCLDDANLIYEAKFLIHVSDLFQNQWYTRIREIVY